MYVHVQLHYIRMYRCNSTWNHTPIKALYMINFFSSVTDEEWMFDKTEHSKQLSHSIHTVRTHLYHCVMDTLHTLLYTTCTYVYLWCLHVQMGMPLWYHTSYEVSCYVVNDEASLPNNLQADPSSCALADPNRFRMAQYGSHVHSTRIYALHRYYFCYFGHLEEKILITTRVVFPHPPSIKVSNSSSKGCFSCIYHVEWVRNTSHVVYHIPNQVKWDLILSLLVSSIAFVYQYLIAFWMYCVDSSLYTGAAGRLSIAWAIDIRIGPCACICVSVHGLRAWDPCRHTNANSFILDQSMNQSSIIKVHLTKRCWDSWHKGPL